MREGWVGDRSLGVLALGVLAGWARVVGRLGIGGSWRRVLRSGGGWVCGPAEAWRVGAKRARWGWGPPQVVTSLGFFCRHTLEGSGGSPTKELVGKAALDKKFEDLRERVKQGEARLSLQDLEPVHVFGWLLSDEQRSTSDSWTSDMLVAHSVATRITSKRSVDGADSKAKKAKKREADEDVTSLFS